MSKVTVETFREAAQRATRNLDGESEEPSDERAHMRELIKEVLSEETASTSVDDVVRRVSQRVQDRIRAMVWPERDLEIKRKQRTMEVDRGAFQAEIVKEVRAMLEEERNG